MVKNERNSGRIVDQKWAKIFNDFHILDKIDQKKSFIIDSSTINKYKEARLMTKFDHLSSLPDIFFKNQLSILPITRGKYIIGNFNAYQKISDSSEDFSKNVRERPFPQWLQSIDTENVTSESTMINIAEISGMLKELLNEKQMYPTVNGRMSSESFSFNITNWNDPNKAIKISVDNSQLEIDAGLETEHSLILIEAKNHTAKSILIRQLYYPFRLWHKHLPNKKIIPIYLQYDSGTYNFSIFKFNDPNNYSSFQLLSRQNYRLGQEPISLEDIINIVKSSVLIEESSENKYTFPQADSLQKIMDIINLLQTKNHETLEDLTLDLDFVYRQAYYYLDAGKYLDLFNLAPNKNLVLTTTGKKFKHLNQKKQRLLLTKQILKHKPFNYVLLDAIQNDGKFTKQKTFQIVKKNNFLKSYGETTIARRCQTINSWLKTIITSFVNDY